MSPPFFQLPSELKLYIYELVLDDSRGIELSKDTKVPEPPVALACRSFRAEILPFFYRGSTFRVASIPLLRTFLEQLGPERAARLTDLRLKRSFWSWDRRWPCIEGVVLPEGALKIEIYDSGVQEWVWMDRPQFEKFWAGLVNYHVM
ncbi:hypothetical protein M409DRAFT_24667 [Zasmidium cellare ATCC 36951]|uniref:F-box domain-containing protein n=1 Tax=Zasmidium cellare ATCC 36951 TaxID=1080233 RepID=A0A6A6CFQ7_ZASCE|nr:uncharacterized protein M409DRAFT_24667 [Zasmidium cellare ATCC 36951]KAF2164762.1 hypothetical protein M409DRAFT_24667 [Zasmidium cellare ATCC 36951]